MVVMTTGKRQPGNSKALGTKNHDGPAVISSKPPNKAQAPQ